MFSPEVFLIGVADYHELTQTQSLIQSPISNLTQALVRHGKVTIWRGPAESCKFLHNIEYKQAIKKRRETCKLKWRL
jgi:hypothetical protein